MAKAAVENNNDYYQGIFWSIYMINSIIGYIIAYFILGGSPNFGTFFLIMSMISVFAFILLLCKFSLIHLVLREPVSLEMKNELEEKEEKDNSSFCGTVISKAKETFVMIGKRKMLPMLLMIFFRAFVLTYYSGVLVVGSLKMRKNPPKDSIENIRAGLFFMIGFGIAEVFGENVVFHRS